MPTLTISITAGSTTTQTMNFSGPDATRILNGYKAVVDPNGDQAGLTAFISDLVRGRLIGMVVQAETTKPIAPTIT